LWRGYRDGVSPILITVSEFQLCDECSVTVDPLIDAGNRGWCARVACQLEAFAPKPGNVHPGADYPDLSHAELLAAAEAIVPAVQAAPKVSLGRTILDAVIATRRVTRSNANLGIVLLLAPLASVPDGEPLEEGVAEVLSTTSPVDAVEVFEAIRMARPGGMGTSERHDLCGPAPVDLLEAMRVAADRDRIAWLWANDFRGLFELVIPFLESGLGASPAGVAVDRGIVRAFLEILARWPDSHIARRHGHSVAEEVSSQAARVLACGEGWWEAARSLDIELRRHPRRNPGTTADLVAAGLFTMLRGGWRPQTLTASHDRHGEGIVSSIDREKVR